MLYALLLLGLLPAAFLFDSPGDDDEDADDFSGSTSETDPGPGYAPGGHEADGPGENGDEAEDLPPEELTVPADSGDAEISGFRPGTDCLSLMVSSEGCGFYTTQDSETGDGILHIEEPDGERLVSFEGLDEVPLEDITICVANPATGSVSEYSLIASGSGGLTISASEPDEPAPDDVVIGPSDPEVVDIVTPADPDDGPPIAPSDPDVEDTPTPGDVTDLPLNPVDTPIEELINGRGGAVDDLLTQNSDSFGSSGVGAAVPLDGTAGADTLEIAAAGTGEIGYHGGTPQLGGTPGLVDAGAGADTVLSHGGSYVFGGEGDDSLTDDGAGSALYGGAGNDQLVGGPGGSHLDGGIGDDVIQGGAGDDVIEGGEHLGQPGGADVIDGGAGDDVIRGGGGADRLSGGDGNDVIDHAGRAEERLSLEERHFSWHVADAVDQLDGGSGEDTLIFGAGDLAHGGLGADQFHLYSSAGAPAVIDDFAPGQDFLRITLDPSQFTDLPSYEVSPSGDGLDGLVKVDGVVVAVLQGAPMATLDDIYVELLPDIAA